MRGSLIISVSLVFIVAAAVWEAREWDLTTKLFPWVIGFPLLVLLGLQIFFELSGSHENPAEAPADSEPRTHEERLRAVSTVGWLLGFVGAVWLFGFGIGGPIATLSYLKLSAREKWPVALTVTISVGVMLWMLAEWLYVPFPRGFIFSVMQT